MSFWKAQPTTIDISDIRQNLSDEKALIKINAELELSRLKLEYIVYEGGNMNINLIKEVLTFINENYLRNKDIKFVYSESILRYYLKNSILLYFHSKGKLVGMIIGKRKNLHIYDKIYNISEANFLCLTPKLRSLHLAPYIIGILVRESVLKLNTSMAYYTIYAPIKSKPFGTKKFFHRIVKTKVDTILPLKYISGSADPLFAEQLEQKLLMYAKDTYSIFDHKNIDEITSILATPDFHNFAFYTDNVLTDFICINSVIVANDNGSSYKNGYIHIVILSNKITTHIKTILDSIVSYCQKYNIIDVLCTSDIFPVSDYSEINFIYSSVSTNYYIYNMNMHNIENNKNGIMII